MARALFTILGNHGMRLEGVDIAMFYPDGSCITEKTDKNGCAYFTLDDDRGTLVRQEILISDVKSDYERFVGEGWRAASKMILFCAEEGYMAFAFNNAEIWEKQEIFLRPYVKGGSIICHRTCHIPNFTGRLAPILDAQERTYLYADNIAINGGQTQPVYFKVGESLTLQDRDGKTIELIIKAMVARSSLIQYEFLPKNHPPVTQNAPKIFSPTDGDSLIKLGHNNPPADEAIESLEDAISSIERSNQPVDNKEELLIPMKEGLESLKAGNASKAILQTTINALKKVYEIFIEAGEVAGKITKAIWKIASFAGTLGLPLLL